MAAPTEVFSAFSGRRVIPGSNAFTVRRVVCKCCKAATYEYVTPVEYTLCTQCSVEECGVVCTWCKKSAGLVHKRGKKYGGICVPCGHLLRALPPGPHDSRYLDGFYPN
jgi:hypothetical protein